MTHPSDISALIGELDELFEKLGDDTDYVDLFTATVVDAWPTLRDTLRKEPDEAQAKEAYQMLLAMEDHGRIDEYGDEIIELDSWQVSVLKAGLHSKMSRETISTLRKEPVEDVRERIYKLVCAHRNSTTPDHFTDLILSAIPHPAPALSRSDVAMQVVSILRAFTVAIAKDVLSNELKEIDEDAMHDRIDFSTTRAADRICALVTPATAWRSFSDFMKEHRLKDPDELEQLKWMEAIAVVPGGKPSRLPVRYRGHPDYGWFVLDSGKPCEVLYVREPLPPVPEGET